jgi:NMD protein affecting ribosome stability and mRNA decay
MRIVVDVFERCRNGEESVWKGGRWVVEVVAKKKTRILCDCRYDVNNVKQNNPNGNNRKTF